MDHPRRTGQKSASSAVILLLNPLLLLHLYSPYQGSKDELEDLIKHHIIREHVREKMLKSCESRTSSSDESSPGLDPWIHYRRTRHPRALEGLLLGVGGSRCRILVGSRANPAHLDARILASLHIGQQESLFSSPLFS